MGEDLRSRLRRIRESRPGGAGNAPPEAADSGTDTQAAGTAQEALSEAGWNGVGYLTAKRSVTMAPPLAIPGELPRSLGILVPDLLRYGVRNSAVSPDDLLFFDLETTGLSTGPGVAAFLAGFGRLAGERFRVDQYLLLDYPGEADFLAALLREFAPVRPEGPLVVSYNGKSFDTQLLRTRCLMNGFPPPEYAQADLLHPSRRLWKRTLRSCSQASVETAVLSLDRSGDVGGAMAPDIWFSFLKSGDPSDLAGVWDHNVRDLCGLLGILCAFCGIAEDPFRWGERYCCDRESLALWWRQAIRVHGEAAFGAGTTSIGDALLRAAAEAGQSRAAYAYRRGLAIEAEWKRKDPAAALRQVDLFLALKEIPGTMAEEMFRRRERLLKKLRQKEGRRANSVFND
ncbi:MAG: ribonuclease H-like domain-containing protein [Treponema sp.]|jgi:uncharacterized protein YprB with RNaseH-like and TPR domain|nr:ribonuclease H-like domain-containing protein [Treponema sp.]